MRISLTSGFRSDMRSVPPTVALWALNWVEAAKSPGATLADMTAGAKRLRNGGRNAYSRRRRGHRLVFTVDIEKNELTFFSVRKREDVYEVAAARIAEMH